MQWVQLRALADAREQLALPALPTGTIGGFLAAVAANPLTALPGLNTRRRDGSLPVALLPARLLAVDAHARGLSGGPGRSYAINGAPCSPEAAAALLASVLDDAAIIASAEQEARDALRAERRATVDNLCAQPDPADGLGFGHRVHAQTAWISAAERAIRPITEADEAAALARALTATAMSLRTSSAARRALLPLVRDALAPDAVAPDPAPALAFLAERDSEPVVRRPDLGRAYAAAGRPGDLADTALYALASERLGPSAPSVESASGGPPPAARSASRSASSSPPPASHPRRDLMTDETLHIALVEVRGVTETGLPFATILPDGPRARRLAARAQAVAQRRADQRRLAAIIDEPDPSIAAQRDAILARLAARAPERLGV